MHNIELKQNDSVFKLKGNNEITVNISVPAEFANEKNISIAYVEENGSVKLVDTVVKDDFAVLKQIT